MLRAVIEQGLRQKPAQGLKLPRKSWSIQFQLYLHEDSCIIDTACRYQFLKFVFHSALVSKAACMSINYAVIRNRQVQLSELHVRECGLNLRLNQEVSTALCHYGPRILGLDGADPLDGDFIALYYQLALRRIGQFKQKISERASYLNASKAVQDTLRLMGVRTALQCDLGGYLSPNNSCKKEALAQQISMALLHLMVCSNSLQHQLIELVNALEAWMNAEAVNAEQGVSHNPRDLRKPTWRITTLGATQPVSKDSYSYIH